MADIASVAAELKNFDWLDLHYSHIPHSIGLRPRGPRGPRLSLRPVSALADGHIPTSAEGAAAVASLASGLVPAPLNSIASGVSGLALLLNGGPGAAKFAEAPRRNGADAFSLANVASGLLTMYTVIPRVPQWGSMHFLTSSLTAIGAMPGLYGMRAARSGAARALYGLSGMGYVANAALAVEAARQTGDGDHTTAANYTHAANAAWMGAWILSTLAGHLESKTAGRDASPRSGDSLHLLGPDNV